MYLLEACMVSFFIKILNAEIKIRVLSLQLREKETVHQLYLIFLLLKYIIL